MSWILQALEQSFVSSYQTIHPFTLRNALKKDSKLRLTTNENGRRKIIEAAEVRRDIVYERLLQNEVSHE